MLASILLAVMYGLRSIQPPEEQKAPVLSAVNDCATSGALPPRIAPMSLSWLIPPTLLTVIPGWLAWKAGTAWLTTPSSRLVKPFHKVIVTGWWLVPPFAAVVELLPEPPPPPHAASASVARNAAAAAMRPIRLLPTCRCIWLDTLTKCGRYSSIVRASSARRFRMSHCLVRLPDEMADATAQRRATAPLLKDLNERTVLEAIRGG